MEVEGSTPDSGQALGGLGEALSKALEAHGMTEEELATGEAPIEAGPEAEAVETPQQAQPEQQPAGVDAPADWPEEQKALFKQQTPEVQKWMLDTHRNMQRDYTGKTEALASQRKLAETVAQSLEPLKPLMQQYGFDDAGAIRHLVQDFSNTRHFIQNLQANPAAAIQQLEQTFGVNIRAALQGQQESGEEYVDPRTQQLESKITRLEQQLGSYTQSQQAQIQAEASQKVQSFKEAKSESGELMYPHFEKVRATLAQWAAVDPQFDLASAYERAVWADPEIRKEILAAQNAERTKAEENKRLDALNKSKKATSPIKPRPSGEKKAKSLDDALAQAMGI